MINEEDIKIKFNEIVEYLKADYPEVNYQLLYFPDTLLPCCYIHSKHEQLKVIQGSINNFQASLYFTVIIDSQCDGYCGYNPEFESLTSDIWDSMSIEGLTLDTLNEAIQKLNIQSSSEVNVMFGPTYDYDIKQWSSRASIWVGYIDPIMRHFLLIRDESRVEECSVNSRVFPVQYWSMTTHLLTRHSDTEETSRHWWEKEIGMNSIVSIDSDSRKPHFRKGSLGPSIKSMFPDFNVPKTWFLTAAHIFEHHKTKFDYSYALQHLEVLNYRDHQVGKLIGVNNDQQFAVIDMDDANDKIKISDNWYIPFIGALGKDYFDLVGSNRDIYKSGATSGLTTGTLSSWGKKVIPRDEYTPQPGTYNDLIIVRKLNTKFSEKGDSGASVFFINNEDKAVVIGIVEAYWKFHGNWELSAVTPFCLQSLKDWITELNNNMLNNTNTSLSSGWCRMG